MKYHSSFAGFRAFRRPPRGGRGLKSAQKIMQTPPLCGRPPRGGRGLKCRRCPEGRKEDRSPPSRGAWIEIKLPLPVLYRVRSPPSRGAWIEIIFRGGVLRVQRGRPPRGGRGLKSPTTTHTCCTSRRPPRGGRGLKYILSPLSIRTWLVAPLAGGVD